MDAEQSEDDINLQYSLDAVFGNSLVVAKICSFTPKVPDLLNFRPLSQLFCCEATKRIRELHQPVELSSDDKMIEFLDRMKTRIEPYETNPFPFVRFKLNLKNSIELLERFTAEVGTHVQSLSFGPALDANEWSLDHVEKLVLLLARIPNLQEIKLTTALEIRLTTSEISKLPARFHHLRCIHVDYLGDAPTIPPDTVPLLSALVARSARLDHVHVQKLEEGDGPGQMNSVYRLLKKHHGQHQPLLSLDLLSTTVRPGSVLVLQEMTNMGIRFKSISIEILSSTDRLLSRPLNEVDIRNVVGGVSAWLAAQSATLTHLSIQVWKPVDSSSLVLPPLAALKELYISSKASNLRNFQVIAPLLPNQFPALRKVSLESYADGLGTFNQCQLPSVRELHIARHRCNFTDPWHTVFPNLTTLNYQVNFIYSRDHTPNVAFVLTHFPRLTHLHLNLNPGLGGALTKHDFWDVLTGGAIRPASLHDLLQGPIGDEAGELEYPADNGVYRVSSLHNLQDLEVLYLLPKNVINLDAIVYMTRAGLLVPLKKLTVLGIGQDFELEAAELEAYRSALAQVHAEVNMEVEVDG